MQILIESLTRDYFRAFSDKDSSTLFKMFNIDIELIDWEESIQGRNEVLKHNQKLFDSVNKINIIPELIAVYGLTAMAKILVEIDGATLNVVDVINFDNFGKIAKIEAYRR